MVIINQYINMVHVYSYKHETHTKQNDVIF